MATLQMALIYSGKKVKFAKFKCMVTGTCIISILFYRNPPLINAVTLDELDDPMEEDNHFLGDNLQDGNPPEDAPPAGDNLQDGNPPEDAPPAGDHQDGNAPEDAPQPVITKTATLQRMPPQLVITKTTTLQRMPPPSW